MNSNFCSLKRIERKIFYVNIQYRIQNKSISFFSKNSLEEAINNEAIPATAIDVESPNDAFNLLRAFAIVVESRILCFLTFLQNIFVGFQGTVQIYMCRVKQSE